ncbi:MAG: hypothetical protein SFV52_06670 [Saprospiraceae bacterium]|nr:hypothetical protein [Saprospiraceae bacterium]
MKQTAKHYFLSGVFLFSLFFMGAAPSCRAQSVGKEKIAIVNASDLLFIVFSDAKGEWLSHYYILQGASTPDTDLGASNVMFEKDFLSIAPRDGSKPRIFALENDTDHQSILSQRPDADVVKGYGLARIYRNEAKPFDSFVDDLRAGKYETMIAPSQGGPTGENPDWKCLVGGCGTTSCKYEVTLGPVQGGCEITCQPTHYACCGNLLSLNSCQCVLDNCK